MYALYLPYQISTDCKYVQPWNFKGLVPVSAHTHTHTQYVAIVLLGTYLPCITMMISKQTLFVMHTCNCELNNV